MLLSELKKGEEGVIKKINASKSFKNRLSSMGIVVKEIVKLKEYSLAKSTIEVKVSESYVALRLKEAALIEVEKL
ncbi:MAG: ferrous iron transport protein A [Campylobacterales bacterium]|nr:ferrous iron transport protein A [Campylobacterales bacterium]